MNKKIKISLLTLSMLTAEISMAGGIFNFPIPQPNKISNDFDGDGQPNTIDPDDDNDGILDEEDSVQFGRERAGESVAENGNSGIDSFSINKETIFNGDPVNLSWSISDLSNLTLFGGNFNREDVSGTNSITDHPSESTRYQLFTGTGSMHVDVTVDPIPTLNHFTANGSSSNIEFSDNETITFSWNIENAKSPTISGGKLGTRSISEIGTLTDTPTEDSTYTLSDGYTTYTIDAVRKVIPMNCKFSFHTNGISIFARRSNSVVNGVRHPWQIYDLGASDSGRLNNKSILRESDWTHRGYTYHIGRRMQGAYRNYYSVCRTPGWE